jgi:hypothetical protein
MRENVDRRVLAGFRCVDAITSLSILSPLSVTAAPLVLHRNQRGVFGVMDAPGLTALTNEFLSPSPSSWPAPSLYEITIQDPSLRYLARRAKIAAPQPLPVNPPPAPSGAATPPVTTPQQVTMYPTTAAPVGPNWAVLRVLVVSNATPPAPLPWAVIQVQGVVSPAPSGLTNLNGEALLAIPGLGLKLSSSSTGAVTEATVAATVTAFFDPATLTQPRGWVPNPDDILANPSSPAWKSASQSVQLGSGQTVFVTITISM